MHSVAGNGKADTEMVFSDLFDVVRRVSVGGLLGNLIERSLEMIESKQQRTVEYGHAGHDAASSSSHDP